MSIEQRFASEKESVARLLKGILGAGAESVAVRLEKELAEEVRYDHRETEPAALATAWGASPSIPELVAKAQAVPVDVSDIPGIVQATYAFRLMTLAHVLEGIGSGDKTEFAKVLSELGLGLKEVEAYRVDFVR